MCATWLATPAPTALTPTAAAKRCPSRRSPPGRRGESAETTAGAATVEEALPATASALPIMLQAGGKLPVRNAWKAESCRLPAVGQSDRPRLRREAARTDSAKAAPDSLHLRVLADRVEAHLRGDNRMTIDRVGDVLAAFPATARELVRLREEVTDSVSALRNMLKIIDEVVCEELGAADDLLLALATAP